MNTRRTTRSTTMGLNPTALGERKQQTRNVLGDISNRTRANGTGYGLAKKTTISKPFTVATTASTRNTRTSAADKQSVQSRPKRQVLGSRSNKEDASYAPVKAVKSRSAVPAPKASLSRQSKARAVPPRHAVHLRHAPFITAKMHPIDMADLRRPQCAAEYVKDMYKHHRSVEASSVASPEYMSQQDDISERMRAILIDWLVEVHHKFKLMPQTLYLTVNTLDRFLERKAVSRKRLQLVGCTAMLIASKYEEIYAPELQDFVYISDRAFDRDDILEMEGIMLNTLKFHMTVPITYVFSTRFVKIVDAHHPELVNNKTKHLVNYIVERTLQEYSMIKYLPSMLAAASLLISLRSLCEEERSQMLLNRMSPMSRASNAMSDDDDDLDLPNPALVWTPEVAKMVQYSEESLMECSQDMLAVIRAGKNKSLQAVFKKFNTKKYMEVAQVPLIL